MINRDNFHEDFHQEDMLRPGSPKAFGFVFSVVFAIIALWPVWNGSSILSWSAILSGLFFIIAFFKPILLQPLNHLWFKFGILLHKIANPLVMGFLFYVTVTPIAIIFKLIGKDPLNRQLDRKSETYWIKRDQKQPIWESMKNQF